MCWSISKVGFLLDRQLQQNLVVDNFKSQYMPYFNRTSNFATITKRKKNDEKGRLGCRKSTGNVDLYKSINKLRSMT